MDFPGITVNGTNGTHMNGTSGTQMNGPPTPPTTDISSNLRPATACSPKRKLKVVTIGAGFSGLIFAHKLQHQHPEFQDLLTHQILEAREDVGGTWLVNRYPGVQCDVPAHIYVRVLMFDAKFCY